MSHACVWCYRDNCCVQWTSKCGKLWHWRHWNFRSTLSLSQHSHQLLDPAKPKKTTQVARKRVAIANKEPAKKKKSPIVKPVMVHGQKKLVIHPHDIQKPMKVTTIPKQEIVHENHQFIHHNSGNLLASSQSSYSSIASASDDLYLKQDLMTICENSYESSEDTGVGGLSENELMSHDVIGSLDMESSDELTKVLCSLPTNTLDDLLTGEWREMTTRICQSLIDWRF